MPANHMDQALRQLSRNRCHKTRDIDPHEDEASYDIELVVGFFFFQAEDGIRDDLVTGVQTCALPISRVVIVGGGYIGLEIAATARHMGCAVSVLEMADRVMNRVVASNVSEYFAHEHRTQGAKIVCNTRVVRFEGDNRVERVVCADGSVYPTDLLVVGVGVIADTQLALDAGLACENGIVVDETCRTTDPAIFAARDCTSYFSPLFQSSVLLLTVRNSFHQNKVARRNNPHRP